LPGKCFKKINCLPIIVHIWRRLMRCLQVDEVIVAWGGKLPMERIFNDYGMRVIAGSEDNLLDRLMLAGHYCHADAILRVRADCLFLDPSMLDQLAYDFRSTYPFARSVYNWPRRAQSEGLDAEIYGMDLLAKLESIVECPREDFGTWVLKRSLAKQLTPECDENSGEPHLSIDTQENLDRAERMMKILGNEEWRYAETLKAWEATK